MILFSVGIKLECTVLTIQISIRKAIFSFPLIFLQQKNISKSIKIANRKFKAQLKVFRKTGYLPFLKYLKRSPFFNFFIISLKQQSLRISKQSHSSQ